MTERCRNCGAELFAGQQFCRQCGARTSQLTHEDVATRILPGQAPAATEPLGGGHKTDPGFGARATGAAYQPPQQVVPLASAPPVAPARRGLGAGWVALLAVVVVLGLTTVCLGIFFALRAAQSGTTARRIVVNPPRPPAVPHPPAVPEPPEPGAAGEFDTLDEENADVSDDKTVITKTYPLAPGAGQFELSNLNGDIKVEGWDEDQAEVKVIKHGGDPEERAAAEIKVQHAPDRLELRTSPGGGVEDVTYEVRLPRRLAHVRLSATNGNVKLSGVHGQIEVTAQNGNLKLEDVSGAVTTKTVSGNTKIVLADAGEGAPQSFNAVSGNVEIELGEEANVEVQADTVGGQIILADSLGLKVEKRLVGQHAAGPIGRGGPPLAVRTVSGNIKIKK
ncbi:MAG TPA: DUF4097 family beta strand repeat-containing protein [Pyrinomonadaceae bacterium]|jgi:hypothetical protein